MVFAILRSVFRHSSGGGEQKGTGKRKKRNGEMNSRPPKMGRKGDTIGRDRFVVIRKRKRRGKKRGEGNPQSPSAAILVLKRGEGGKDSGFNKGRYLNGNFTRT